MLRFGRFTQPIDTMNSLPLIVQHESLRFVSFFLADALPFLFDTHQQLLLFLLIAILFDLQLDSLVLAQAPSLQVLVHLNAFVYAILLNCYGIGYRLIQLLALVGSLLFVTVGRQLLQQRQILDLS